MFSATKSVAAIVFATLVDRGIVDYDDRVCDHWPEFAANGKEGITVADVMRHEAGLVYLDDTVMIKDMRTDAVKANAIGAIIEVLNS